jgi:hypothetical protein
MGRLISDAAFRQDPRNASEYGWGVAGMLFDAFSPMGSASSLSQFVVPSVIKPILQLTENKGFAGSKTYKSDDNGFGRKDPKPAYTRYFENTPDIWKAASRGLNDISGGDKDVPGKINLEPDILKHVFYSLTGGPGRTFDQLLDSTQAQARGNTPTPNRLPLVSRFYSENDDRQRQRVYYDDRKRAVDAKVEFEYFNKIGRPEMAREVAQELGNGDRMQGLRMMNQFENTQKSVSKINKQIRQELDRKDNGEDRTVQLKSLKDRRSKVMGRAVQPADEGED